MGKEAHVLPNAITLRYRTMTIEVVVFVFASV